jgi:uncharacterized protein YlaI
MSICKCGKTYDSDRQDPNWRLKDRLPPLSVYMCPRCEREKRDQVKAHRSKKAMKKATTRHGWKENATHG